jgi:DNA-binding CsgD family transcriptional regulator
MTIRNWMSNILGWRTSSKRSFQINESLIASLQEQADLEQLSADELAADLLTKALQERQAMSARLQDWSSLSAREQEVAALTCLNYTNRQIAAQLNISPETVKTHIKNALVKFNLRTKQDLKQSLADWDFNAWGKHQP